jgi:HlyD family secretion protein
MAALMPLLGAAIIGVVRGKWFALSASVTLVALVAVAIAMLSRISANKTKPAVLTTQAPPPVEVHLSGKIRAQSVISVAPPVEGTIGAVFADVGQEVFEGQLLARITNEGLETGQQMAQKLLDNAQSRVNTLEGELVSARLEASRARADANRARSEYDRLSQVFRRQQMLLAEGATPKLTYDKSSREFEAAQAESRTLEQLATQAESRLSELVKSLDAEKRALADKSAEMENTKARAAATEVVSPAQGVVVARNGEAGQSVGPDKADFFQIATQLSQLEVVLDPDPPTMRRIRLGQAALVTLPEQNSDGMLGAVKAIQGAQVIVAFTSPTPAVKPGMLAQVRIKVS